MLYQNKKIRQNNKKCHENDKNKQKKNIAGIFFISNKLYVFYLPKLTMFFGNQQQPNARAG